MAQDLQLRWTQGSWHPSSCSLRHDVRFLTLVYFFHLLRCPFSPLFTREDRCHSKLRWPVFWAENLWHSYFNSQDHSNKSFFSFCNVGQSLFFFSNKSCFSLYNVGQIGFFQISHVLASIMWDKVGFFVFCIGDCPPFIETNQFYMNVTASSLYYRIIKILWYNLFFCVHFFIFLQKQILKCYIG